MKKPRKILIIIQRSNGDVFLSGSLIKKIYDYYVSPQIDLLVNDDTLPIAKLLPHVNKIHTFSYQKKSINRWSQEKDIFFKLFNRYHLSINLTSSDRSVLYALIAGKNTISVVEKDNKKSWWKKKLLSNYYYYDTNQHIIIQNLTPLGLLGIESEKVQLSIDASEEALKNVLEKLKKKNIKDFLIFHPSAQYHYKMLPKILRDELLFKLSKLGVSIVISGSNNNIDTYIKNELPILNNVYDFIGETSLEEYFALSHLSIAYVGMDTLNMHIAASQNKRIFAIFGPTKLSMWSPWSNQLKKATSLNKPIQTYGENTIFQSYLPCEICGLVGCGNNHGKNEFKFSINLDEIVNEISHWYKNYNSLI